MNKVDGRVCWSCKHFQFTDGCAGYSDVTPGNDATMECDKKVFRVQVLGLITEKELRTTLTMAETCDKFDARIPKV